MPHSWMVRYAHAVYTLSQGVWLPLENWKIMTCKYRIMEGNPQINAEVMKILTLEIWNYCRIPLAISRASLSAESISEMVGLSTIDIMFNALSIVWGICRNLALFSKNA